MRGIGWPRRPGMSLTKVRCRASGVAQGGAHLLGGFAGGRRLGGIRLDLPERGHRIDERDQVGHHEYVPLRQARHAMLTWIGDPRVSLRRAKQTAQAILGQLDNPTATPAARRELRKVLTNIGYTGHLDADQLERAESVIGVATARLTAVTLLQEDRVSDEAFYQARHAQLMAYAEYAVNQSRFAASALYKGPACTNRSPPNERSTTAAPTC